MAVYELDEEMHMPCNCPRCGELVELNAMKDVRDGRARSLVCRDCWYEIKQEQEP